MNRTIMLNVTITVNEDETDATDNEIAHWAQRVLNGEIAIQGAGTGEWSSADRVKEEITIEKVEVER
jgi:hypothetical protein